MSDNRSMSMTVGEAANLVGVSVRTLHHWEQIGLLVPAARSSAGYRLYGPADIERIHQILVYRETGMALADIAQLLGETESGVAPATLTPSSATAHLARQRKLLTDRIARLQEMVSAVDTMMEKKKMGIQLTPEEQVEIFGKDWKPEWQDEARERWDDPEVWSQYADRTAKLTKDDYRRITAEIKAMEAQLGEAKRNGVQPGTERANQLAELHRASLDQWFDVPYARQILLARMYTQDPQFAKHYNDIEPDLTPWLLQIVEANARAHGVDTENVQW